MLTTKNLAPSERGCVGVAGPTAAGSHRGKGCNDLRVSSFGRAAADAPTPRTAALRWLSLILAFLFICGCADRGARALLEGEQLLRNGKYTEAVARLSDAVHQLPQNAQAWNYLGLAYQHAGQAAKAAEAYQQALRLDRALAAAHYNLGCVLLETNFAPAVEEFVAYTKLEPQKVDGWIKLGVAQLRQASRLSGNEKAQWLNVAKQNLETSVKISVTAEAYNALGVIEVRQNRYRDAVRFFNAALQKEANYPAALLNLAIVNQTYFHDRRAALQKYREFLAAQPRSSRFKQVEEIAHGLDVEINPQVITNAASARFSPAPSTSSATPGNNAVRETKTETAAPKTTSQFSTAEKGAAKLVTSKPATQTSAPAFPRYKFQSPAKPAPGNRAAATSLYNQGSDAHRIGDWKKAGALFQQAIKSDPSFFEAHFKLGLLSYQKEEWPTCLQSYELALAISPDSTSARYNFALALQKAGFVPDAIQELGKILKKNPADVRSHLMLANIYAQRLRQKETARRHYQKVLELEPQHVEAANIRHWLAQN